MFLFKKYLWYTLHSDENCNVQCTEFPLQGWSTRWTRRAWGKPQAPSRGGQEGRTILYFSVDWIWEIRNPNIHNRDHLIGRPTKRKVELMVADERLLKIPLIFFVNGLYHCNHQHHCHLYTQVGNLTKELVRRELFECIQKEVISDGKETFLSLFVLCCLSKCCNVQCCAGARWDQCAARDAKQARAVGGEPIEQEIIFVVILTPRIWYSCYYCSVTEKRMLWSYLMPRLTMRLEVPKAGARRAAS